MLQATASDFAHVITQAKLHLFDIGAFLIFLSFLLSWLAKEMPPHLCEFLRGVRTVSAELKRRPGKSNGHRKRKSRLARGT